MGVWLLTIESLILALLWVAAGLAWQARKPSLGKDLILAMMILFPLAVYAALLIGFFAIDSHTRINPQLGYALSLLLAGYLLGAIVLFVKARKPSPTEARPTSMPGANTLRRATRWPAGKLALAVLVAFVLHAMTFWNLDTAVQHRLEALRVEAGAKALSVAPGKPADRENAALVYAEAFKLMPKYNEMPKAYDDWVDSEYVAQHPEIFKDPQLLAFLQTQAPTIKLLHQAAALPDCSFDRNYAQPSIDMMLPEVQDMRTAARIVLLQARVDAAQGDLLGAVEEIQTVFLMGEHVASDPLLITMLVSIASDGMAVESLQAVLSDQQPTLAELAPLVFGPPHASPRRLSRAMRMEEAFGLATFGQVANQPGMWAMIDGTATPGPNNPAYAFAAPPGLAMYRVLLLEDDVAAYREQFVEYQALAPLSPAQWHDRIDKLKGVQRSDRRGILTSMLAPALSACYLASARHAAKMETMQTGIAIHRYRAKHGQLPKQLADLVPEYLPSVPLDPYTDQALLWKPGQDWVVYSVGEDLKDDQGAPYDSTNRTGDIGFYAVDPTSPANPPAAKPSTEGAPPEPVEEE